VNPALGIDIGGTHLRAAVVAVDGTVIRSLHRKLPVHDPAGVLQQVLAARQALEYPQGPIGIGLAACMLLAQGLVTVAPNLGWVNVPFGDMLKQHLGQPVRLVNDLDAITMGEARFGAGAGASDVVCMFLGTGLGMGALVHGTLLEGADGLATELGHIRIASVTDGRRCGCGQRGCLEAYTSGRHLPELLLAKIAEGVPCALANQPAETVNAAAIEAAAQRGDQACCQLWQDIGTRVAQALGCVVTLLNPRVLVLGGGVLTAAPSLLQQVCAQLTQYAAPPVLANLRVSEARLGDIAGVVGAACLARES